MIDYKDTEQNKWYWLWVTGPDGPVWMLARRQTRWPDGFCLANEGAGDPVYKEDHGHTIRGKWTILEIHPCKPPERS